MMFKAATLLTVLSSPLLVDGAPCLDSVGDATVIDTNSCSYNTLVTALEGVLADIDGCDNTAEEELQEIFGVDSESDVQEEIARRCNDAVDVLDFESLTGRGEIFDKEYYDGGTYWNEEREYYKNKIPEDKLKTDPGQRIDYIKRNLAEKDHITWPDYMDNFEDCELRAAMCCFVQDRQARDNNGNCNTPYEENCVDSDPGDNTDICYTDMSRAPTSSRTNEGFAIFEDDLEDSSHCHGLAWAQDASDKSARFKGNNLFFISMFDHFYQRGYVRNVPGAPMCGCVEKMPVVTRSDCTQIDVDENAKFTYADGALSVEVTNFDIDFNACQGANNNNNDLEAYYEQLVDEDKADPEELEDLHEHLVGETYCREAIDSFLATQDIAQAPACPLSEPDDCGCMIVEQSDYRGTMAVSKSGYECKNWTDRSANIRDRYPNANLVENYCRNPSGKERAWCYTTEPGVDWEYCDVRECMAPLPTSTPSAAPSVSPQPTGQLSETFNLASTGEATQSSTCHGGGASRAIDGGTNSNWRNGSITHTCQVSGGSWWKLALPDSNSIIEKIVIWNRLDCCSSRLSGTTVEVLGADGEVKATKLIESTNNVEKVEFTFDNLVYGAGIKIYNTRKEYISLAEVEVFGKVERSDAPSLAPSVSAAPTGELIAESINLARGGTASQTCTGFGGNAARAIDGNNNWTWGSRTISHTCKQMNAWWKVDLPDDNSLIEKIVVWNRLDCCSDRLSNSEVQIIDKDGNIVARKEIEEAGNVRSFEFEFDQRTFGKTVKVMLDGNNHLQLAEVEVIGKQRETLS
jgi:hypothetical protein